MDVKSIPIAYLVRSFLSACSQQGVSTVVIYTSIEKNRASMHAASNTGPEGVQAALAALNKTDEAAIEAAAEALWNEEDVDFAWEHAPERERESTRKRARAVLAAAHAASVAKLVEENPPPRLIV